MAGRIVLTSIEDVKSWFDNIENNPGKWKMFHGEVDRFDIRSKAWRTKKIASSVEEAWEELEDAMRTIAKEGGRFTIWVPNNGQHGVNTKVSLNEASRGRNTSLNGIPSNMVSREEMEYRLSSQKQMLELKQELQDVKAGQEGNLGLGEAFKSWLFDGDGMDQLLPIVGPFVANILGGFAKSQVIPQQVPVAQPVSDQAPAQGQDPQVELLQSIRSLAGTDDNYLNAIKVINQKIKENPNALISLFNNQSREDEQGAAME